MGSITTRDGTEIYYKDWGEGPVVTFSHGWPLNADAWDGQMLFLAQQGYRVIAHDRRGHGRSTQSSTGNEMNSYADDLATLIEQLDLKGITMVGHSTGGGEVTRYIGRHGTARVAAAVLIGAVPPLLLKTPENPQGIPREVFDGLRSGLFAERGQFWRDFALPFYGANRPGAKVSPAVLDQFWRLSMQAGLKNAYECIKAFSETDFTEDLKRFDIPTLLIHGEDDQIVPIDLTARKSMRLIKDVREAFYPGAPHGLTTTHQDAVNAELLKFLKATGEKPKSRSRVAAAVAGRPLPRLIGKDRIMKIVVIGGTGLIGSKVVARLRERGHDAVPASPDTGVNTLTGTGLAAAFELADVVIDVSNSPSFEDAAVLNFFQTSTTNILAAEKKAGVRHHVALSVVGTERMGDSGYMRAKQVQEKLIRESGVPYTIVHATQFFEFVPRLVDGLTVGNEVRVPPVLFQPMAAEDVAKAVALHSIGNPANEVIEIGGPQQFRFDELVRRFLAARKDSRQVVPDPKALYSGATLNEWSLVPSEGAQLGEITLEQYLKQQAAPPQPVGAGR